MATAAPTSACTHGSTALLDHLARLMRLRAESALEPLGLRPRHLVALTVLRDHGSPTQQALGAALQTDRTTRTRPDLAPAPQPDRTNLIGLLNELETDGLILRRRSSEDRRRHIVELTHAGSERLSDAETTLAAPEDEGLGG